MADYKITNDQTLEQIQEKFKEDDLKKYTPHYDKVSNPIHKSNDIWKKDMLRSGVERFFLLKNNLMRQIMETYGEYVGDIDYDKNVKITYKSEIKDDKEDWNANFTQAFINNFGSVALSGEFTIPPVIVNYIKNRCIPDFHVSWAKTCLAPQYINRFEEAVKRVEMCVKGGINEYVAMATVGCMYNEDNWAPKSSGICYDGGESMIGLTALDMKIRIVKRCGLLGYPGMVPYNFGISKLPNELQFKCCYDFWEHESGGCGKFIINSGKNGMDFKTNQANMTAACVAAYVSKAGIKGWTPNNILGGLDERCRAYFNKNKYEGFSTGMFMAYALGKYIKAKSNGGDLKEVIMNTKKDIAMAFPGIK